MISSKSPCMKTRPPISVLLSLSLLLLALPAVAAPPTITLTTPALNLSRDILIIGTATDTAEAAATDGRVALAGVKEVLYQIEGSKKWRRAQLTGKNASTTGWMVPFENKSATGKRILFYAVDRSGQGSAVLSTRFKRSTTSAATTTPANPNPGTNPGVAPATPIVFGN